MNKKLLTELRGKKEASKSWKQRQVSQEEYSATVWTRRNAARKDKAGVLLSYEGREGQQEGIVQDRKEKKGRMVE